MPRYFFDVLQKGRRTADVEGTVFETVEGAKADALVSAKELAKQAIDNDVPPGTVCLEITDETGTVVAALTIAEVLEQPVTPEFHQSCEPEV